MILPVPKSKADFYREFLMGRSQFDPKDFGINLSREEFIDKMVDEFNLAFQGRTTVDELVLHPRDALRFCDDLRHRNGYFDLPDDIILRVIMQRRKNPNAV
jgi:hypothetical protein